MDLRCGITAQQKHYQQLRELDFILSPSGTMIYIGTPHTYDTIYRTDTASVQTADECA